jgi:hypothetical protein
VLCKSYESQTGCSYKDKCQFAHGVTELKSFESQQGQGQGIESMQFNNNMNIDNNFNNQQPKYKTMLCKNFESPSGCSYNDKCQFAHGVTELKSFGSQQGQGQGIESMLFNNNNMNMNMNYQQQNFQNNGNNNPPENAIKKLPNPQNYKIVKCKNFDMGTCKYANSCTFAHGEAELRTKNENSFLPTQGGNNSMPNNYNNNMNNNNNNFMQMYNPYMQQMPQENYQNMYNNNNIEWNNENQMYNFQQFPMQGSENMVINPNNINLNMNGNENSMGMNPNMNPHMNMSSQQNKTQN